MHLIELVWQRNPLSGRKHITPLGWIVMSIMALFIAALILGWYRQIARNVNVVEASPTVALAQVIATSEPTSAPAASAQNDAPSWTVKIVRTPLGLDAVEAPPEITRQVLADYDDALEDWDAHKFELDYLKTRAPDYFIGKQLSRMQALLNWMEKEKRTVAMREYTLLPLERSVQFAPNGTQTFLLEYIRAGNAYEYDLTNRARVSEQSLPDRVVVTEMSYDSDARRWKISRFALALDFTTKQVLWQDR